LELRRLCVAQQQPASSPAPVSKAWKNCLYFFQALEKILHDCITRLGHNRRMTTTYAGIIPPLVTPLTGRDALDVAGLEKLVEHVIAGGVSGIFILGTTGEGPSLSYRLRRELIERACKLVRRRVRVLVGITDTAFVESVNVAQWAAEAGADAVVLAPPYYLPEGQPELREYLDCLVPELPLPLFLYNMPALTKVQYELDTLRHAMENPRIIGLKDSSGNMPTFTVLSGC
jgi:4-hydroxy-tetrahydrodipicolinate synthase